MMYNLSASIYDAIYSFKDYAAEATTLQEIAEQYKLSPGKRLLDIACGTGQHLTTLTKWYECEGLDLEPGLLAVAEDRLPQIPFHIANMSDFRLDHSFDVITCLFSAIGYVTDPSLLAPTLAGMIRHLNPGGVLMIEPWFQPGEWFINRPHMSAVDRPELKIARLNTSTQEGDLSICDFHYLVATPDGVQGFEERHVLRLVKHEEMEAAFRSAGLDCRFLEPGLSGRGLFVGVKPL